MTLAEASTLRPGDRVRYRLGPGVAGQAGVVLDARARGIDIRWDGDPAPCYCRLHRCCVLAWWRVQREHCPPPSPPADSLTH